MGRLQVLDRDNDFIPQAMLSLVKANSRIITTAEDAFVKNVILRAVSEFEVKTDTLITPTELKWYPDAADFTDTGYAVIPETPVGEDFKVWDGSEVDVSDDYQIITVATKGVGRYALSGSHASGMRLEFIAGYDDIANIPGGIQNWLMLYSGYLYENREGQVTVSDRERWLNFTASWWKPSV
jgi:hypothetical protein